MDALADALKAEVPLVHAGSLVGVEAASVVRDDEGEPSRLAFAADGDARRLAVADRVDGEFADDAEDRVDGVVGAVLRADGAVEDDLGGALVGLERPRDRGGEGLFLEGAASEVPEAVAEVLSAAAEARAGGIDAGEEQLGLVLRGELHGIELQGDASQVLGDRVVQFDGEAGPLLGSQVGRGVGDLLFRELSAPPLDQSAQEAVPDGESDQDARRTQTAARRRSDVHQDGVERILRSEGERRTRVSPRMCGKTA